MTARYLTAAVLQDLTANLTARDKLVLRRVSDLRFVSGGQLARLCFADSNDATANARAARRSLLRLTRLALLARLPRPIGGVHAGSAGFVYYLGLAGQRLATAQGWQPERRRRRSLTPGTLFVRHTLQIAELHTRLIEADRSGRVELLALSAEPACWRQWSGHGNLPPILKPDSYVRLGTPDYEDSAFIEVDRGTEGSRALDRQLRTYVAYYDSGQEQAAHGVFPKTLWLAPTDQRVAAIADCIGHVARGVQALFQVARFEDAVRVLSEEYAS